MGDIDVLIIGAGPTGSVLALELATQNVSFRIIDSTPIRSDKSRALAVQSRSLELLNHHGIAQKLIEGGFPNLGVRIFCNKRFVLSCIESITLGLNPGVLYMGIVVFSLCICHKGDSAKLSGRSECSNIAF
jgi:2-polyprenyl-6-methoxyphenol hydroxylase-like FAD-dependent oxidoreductase